MEATLKGLVGEFEALFRGYHGGRLARGSAAPNEDVSCSNDEDAVVLLRPWNTASDWWFRAAELLALLAVMDWEMWKHHVKEIWPESDVNGWLSKPRRMIVDITFSGSSYDTQLVSLSLSSMKSAHPSEFAQARALAQKIFALQNKVVNEVPVRLTYHNGLDAICQYGALLPLAVAHARATGTASENRTPIEGGEGFYGGLRVREIRHRMPPQLDVTALECLSMITANDVGVNELGKIHEDTHDQCPRLLMQSLWDLLAIGETDEATRRRGAKHFTVNLAAPSSANASVFSAIRASRSLRSVTTQLRHQGQTTAKQRKAMWPWIAYALFCDLSGDPERLEEVTLDVESFNGADFKKIQQVMSAADPLARVVGRAASLAMQSISASRFWLADPTIDTTEGNAAPPVDCSRALQELAVLKRSKQWTTVLLPGWGEAWVRHDDVLATHHGDRGPFKVQLIPRVTLTSMTDESKEAVMKLLRVLGPGIHHLTVQGKTPRVSDVPAEPTTVVFDGWIAGIFKVCPNLKSLKIGCGQIDDLQFLLDGYTSGKCKLSSFTVFDRRTQMAQLDKSVLRLFAALSDRHHPATQHLREFRYKQVAVKDLIKKATQTAIKTMLEQNDKLRVFELRFAGHDSTKGRRDQCTKLFEEFNGETLRTALNIHRRIAFLSCQRGEGVGHTRARESLDSDALSLIFRLAGSYEKRRVCVEPDYGGYY